MLDDSNLVRRKITFRDEPAWARNYAPSDDPIKLPHSVQYCPCCNKYCIYDYFRNRFLTDVATSRCLKVGMGKENREITDFATLMRSCRNGAYKIWITYLAEILPPTLHGWLNQCIVDHVQKIYPDPHKDYEPLQYSISHMHNMLALKRSIASAALAESSSSDEESLDEAV